jgi:hypothetical protein
LGHRASEPPVLRAACEDALRQLRKGSGGE